MPFLLEIKSERLPRRCVEADARYKYVYRFDAPTGVHNIECGDYDAKGF